MDQALLFLKGMGENKIGLEIRKSMAIDKLFTEVDLVLKDNDILPDCISKSVESQTVAHVLHRMINEGEYFSHQTVQRCATMSHITISSERNAVYKSIDCMAWGAMTNEYRQLIVAMVLDDFRSILNPKV